MKKILLSFAIILCLSSALFASKRPVIYVAAPSGITLREGPNRHSAKIIVLPYGSRISNYNFTETSDTADGYVGTWLRVAVNGKDGYIFSGFTIPILPPTSGTKDMFAYLNAALGEKKATDSIETGEGIPIAVHHYRSNIIYQTAWYMYSAESSLINLNMSVQEAYLLFYLLENNVGGVWSEYYYSDKHGIPFRYPEADYKTENNKVTLKDWDHLEMAIGYCNLRIYRYQSYVLLSWIEGA